MSSLNIRPLHGDLQTVGTNTTADDLHIFDNNRGFTDLKTVGTNTTADDLQTSSYQYILGATMQQAEEGTGVLDTYSRIITQTVHEFIGNFEQTDTRPIKVSDDVGILDETRRIITKTAHEFIGVADTVSISRAANENVGILDLVSRVITRTAHEFIGALDSTSTQLPISGTYTTNIIGKTLANEAYTTSIGVRSLLDSTYTTSINSLKNDLVGITASGGTSAGSNPISPVVAIGGVNYIGSAPPEATNTSIYINLPSTGIDIIPSWGNLLAYSFHLDYSGGAWDLTSKVSVSSLGSSFTMFGFKAAITAGGGTESRRWSNNLKGYWASGIFGNPLLNRQINLIIGGSIVASPIILTPFLLNAQQFQWMTAKTIVTIIAQITGVSIYWGVQDVPVKDFSLEPGATALSVLSSMAARAGATLRWFGNNSYHIVYPDYSIGTFTVPSQKLIAAGGVEAGGVLDLETGVGGAVHPNGPAQPNQGVYVLNAQPIDTNLLLGITPAPPTQEQTNSTNTPTITQVAKVTKLLTEDDPPLVFDLPYDYDQVYLQILIPAGQSTSGSNGASLRNFITTNPAEFFYFDISGALTGQGVGGNTAYIFNTFIGNAYIPQFKVDHTLFAEDNGSIASGNFVLTVACTRKGLGGAFDNARDAIDNDARSIAQRQPQFIKTYQGTINCLFFGVIPLPGMYGSATVDDYTVQGVIENVSFSSNGILTLQVAQYKRINYIQPLSQINALT